MALMKKMTLLKRSIVWLSAVSFVSFFLLACIVWEVRETVRESGLLHIQKILNHKIDTIDMYIDERYSALNNLTQLFYVASHHQNILEENFWNKVSNDLDGNLEIFANNNHFYDIFLIMTDGEIINTVKHENDLHTNLLSGAYQHTQLARVFRDALKNSKPHLSDFDYYEPSHDYAAFIAQPIVEEGKIVAILAVQVDKKAIYAVVNDYSELGQTGQVLASVIREGKLMSMIPVRHSNINPYTVLDFPQNTAIRNAVKGGKGQAYMIDRLGHDVAVAWDYQNDLHWGLTVQIDASELLASWYTMSTFLTLLFFSGVLIVGCMLIMAFRSFAKPIQELTRNAQMMSEGDYDIPLDSEEYDQEWQLLIRVFKQMSVEISRRMTQLNEQNELLTMQKNEIKELNLHLEAKIELKSKQLQEYIHIVDQYVITSQTDANGVITNVSEAFCQISGYTKEELIGQNHRIVRHPDMPDELYADLWETITSGKIWHGEIKNSTSDGKYYWVDTTISPNFEDEKIIGYTAIRHDITNQKMIEELSITDSMTGLYNRRHYVIIIQEEMNRVKRHHHTMALMMLDVDNFKLYNDTYGHQDGDKVLNAVADVLKSYTSRSGEYAFRLGGEEFGVVVSDMSIEGYIDLANRIRNGIEGLAIIHEKNDPAPYVTISVGIAEYRHDENMSCEDLYKEADTQLYIAKEKGRNQVMIREKGDEKMK